MEKGIPKMARYPVGVSSDRTISKRSGSGLKLTNASSDTSWFPINLTRYPQSVDHTGVA
jgi:hypothetical protein